MELHYNGYCPHCDEYQIEAFTPLQEMFVRYETYCKETGDREVSTIVDYIRKFEDADAFEEQLKALLFNS